MVFLRLALFGDWRLVFVCWNCFCYVVADYIVGNITLHSEKGQTARVQSPWNGQQFRVQNTQTNTAVPVNNEGNGVFSFKTVSKNDYKILQS